MSAAIKTFKSLHGKIARLQNSARVKHHGAYLEELENGWGTCRRYNYRKSAEAAYERMEALEEEVYELWDAATEEERRQMEAIDTIALTDGI